MGCVSPLVVVVERVTPERSPGRLAEDDRGWIREHWFGGAGSLHARPMPADGRRRLSLLEVRRPAIVLGSTSTEPSAASWDSRTVDVVRRRSGGGLVWLDPVNSTWIDVFVPRTDPLHQADVGRAFLWLGNRLAAAARRAGLDARVHNGPYRPGPDRGLVCFEGLGAGEVVVGAQKLIGISQRRTRAGSRFQCVWYRRWELGALSAVLDSTVSARAATAGVGTDELGVSGASTLLPGYVFEAIADHCIT